MTVRGIAVQAALAVVTACALTAGVTSAAAIPAFPGAVGQGAASVGGRGGDVYHVTTLTDYNPKTEQKIEGSLRHAIRSAEGPRTIVFDVAGGIRLHAPLEISKSHLTIAGQTSPGGVTLWGYPTEVTKGTDVVVRYLRLRLGDFNARRPRIKQASLATNEAGQVVGNNDMDPGSANAANIGGGCQRVIFDHVSASWSIDETLSVTKCRDVTVQNSIIAEALNHSLHPKGDHGYGSLIRGELTPADQEAGIGGYTLYGNLWAHNRARNPSIGGQQFLAPGVPESERRHTDANIVNNVVYDWGDQATHRSDLGEVRINLVGNYYITGAAKGAKYFFREKTVGRTELFEQGNYQDLDRDADHDGTLVAGAAAVAQAFEGFTAEDSLRSEGGPLNFFGDLGAAVRPAEAAYAAVVKSAGASLWRDAIDRRLIDSLTSRTGNMANSQEQFRDAAGVLPGIDDLKKVHRESGFDSDEDGMPDEFEKRRGLDANDPSDRNGTKLSREGYTNLEVYLSELTEGAEDE